MIAGERNRGGVGSGRDRDDVAEPVADDGKGSLDFRPRTPPLLVRDMGEFVERLRADDAPRGVNPKAFD